MNANANTYYRPTNLYRIKMWLYRSFTPSDKYREIAYSSCGWLEGVESKYGG